MPIKVTFSTFLERLPKVHTDRPIPYEYDESSYTTMEAKMRIKCHMHGWFWQIPAVHIRGSGCQQCGNKKQALAKTYSKEEWVELAKSIWGDRWDYSDTVFINYKTKVGIRCRDHGVFFQMPGNHIHNKQGCPVYPCDPCAKRNAQKEIDSLETFRKKGNHTHGGKYEYPGPYINAVTPTAILCKVKNHGIFKQRPNDHLDGHGCPKCGYLISRGQTEIAEYIRKSGLEVQENFVLRNNKEIDVYVPGVNIGIEFNGLRWHCERYRADREYHYSKTVESNNQGIQLIHIFEDEWGNFPDKVKRFLDNKLGLSTVKFDARKLSIRTVPWGEASDFLNSIHLQGAGVPAQFTYGLYDGDNLVCVMCFSDRNVDREKNQIELTRFCSKGQVRGGFSKLLKHFIRQDSSAYASIISYSENRWSNGDVYANNEFVLDSEVPISYWWYKEGSQLREHRRFFQHKYLPSKLKVYDPHKTEVENCHENGYFRIWDCGKKKWVYHLPKQ